MPSEAVEEVPAPAQPAGAPSAPNAESTDKVSPVTTAESTAAVDAKAEKKQTSPQQDESESSNASRPEEGVEVVLNEVGTTKVVETPPKEEPRPSSDQDVFRHPQTVRPTAMRAAQGPPGANGPPPHAQPYLHGSGSWGGYGPPPPHGAEYPPRPYPVPYNPSGSFDEQGSYHQHSPNYSPHGQYPPPRSRHPSEDVNVISPNHRTDPHYRPPLTPRPKHLSPPQHYYQYPPASPVSRPGQPMPTAPPRMRNMRRADGPYSKAQRNEGDHYQPTDGTWNPHTHASPTKSAGGEMSRPPLVTESSFDSGQRTHHSSHSHPSSRGHPSPYGSPPHPHPPHDSHQHFYGGAPGSWGSFESNHPPPQHHSQGYYGFPPESPYSPYGPYSPGAHRCGESFPPPPGYGPPPPHHYSYSYDDEERLLRDYHPDADGDRMYPRSGRGRKGSTSNTMANASLLPKAAEEVDFEVTDPPSEPVVPPSEEAICDSLADVNTYDVLCGRGGGTNSQIGNRRFRQLVQDFQPIYLLARRKEKPLLARTIVIIIRKRGGRFLKKDDSTGELFEVGDSKAEAKTSQALREGLDVRATKSAASSLLEKKKKKQLRSPRTDNASLSSPLRNKNKSGEGGSSERPEPPPTLPKLQDEERKAGNVHPRSPSASQYRKRSRMRTTGYDKFFNDFCPPRADFQRPNSPGMEDGVHMDMLMTPIRKDGSRDEDSIRCDSNEQHSQGQGCAGIAFDMVTGVATQSFCLGPGGWRR